MAPTRRRVLGAVTATVTLAGCLGGSGGEVGTGTDTETAMDGESTPTETSVDGESTPTADGEATSTAAGTATPTGGGMATTVQVRTHDELGDILVDGSGMTLYMFTTDTQGAGASTCSGGCASAWPPLTVEGDPEPGEGVTAELTTFDRGEGTMQVAANGWPLYYYASDSAPGDSSGQGVSGVWWVLGPDGTPKRGTETPTATDTSDGIDY